MKAVSVPSTLTGPVRPEGVVVVVDVLQEDLRVEEEGAAGIQEVDEGRPVRRDRHVDRARLGGPVELVVVEEDLAVDPGHLDAPVRTW